MSLDQTYRLWRLELEWSSSKAHQCSFLRFCSTDDLLVQLQHGSSSLNRDWTLAPAQNRSPATGPPWSPSQSLKDVPGHSLAQVRCQPDPLGVFRLLTQQGGSYRTAACCGVLHCTSDAATADIAFSGCCPFSLLLLLHRHLPPPVLQRIKAKPHVTFALQPMGYWGCASPLLCLSSLPHGKIATPPHCVSSSWLRVLLNLLETHLLFYSLLDSSTTLHWQAFCHSPALYVLLWESVKLCDPQDSPYKISHKPDH